MSDLKLDIAESIFECCERLRDCRYGKLFGDIVNYRQFDECKHMRDFTVIEVWASYCRMSSFAGESISLR